METVLPTGERIASLESHMVDQDKKLDQIQAKLDQIQIKLDLQSDFDKRLDMLEKFASNSRSWEWLRNTISACVGAVLTILILNYLDKLR